MAESNRDETVSNTTEKAHGFQELLGVLVGQMKDVLLKKYDLQTGRFIERGRESLSPSELFVVDLFERVTEIDKSKERINQILKLATAPPLSRLALDPMEYLQFLIEVYYQELYIMTVRIERWLLYHERKLGKANPDRLKCERLRTRVKEGFSSARKVRAAHVHERRYSTEDLSWAAGVSLIARTREDNDPELPVWMSEARRKYRESRKSFVTQADTEAKLIDQLLNVVAEEMLPIISIQLK